MKLNPIAPFGNLFVIGTVLILLIATFSCSSSEESDTRNEGVIVYDVSFPQDKDNPYINIFPQEMTFTFKDDKVRAKLSSFAEVVSSELIIDNAERKFNHFFKVFDEKYRVELDDDGVIEMISGFPEIKVENTSERDSLAGIICKKSLAYYLDRSSQPVILYHTPMIDLAAPNWFTQFKDLQEVLLGYEIEQFGKKMRLTAREVRYEAVNDNYFEAPSGYEQVSLDEMESKIGELVAQFEE